MIWSLSLSLSLPLDPFSPVFPTKSRKFFSVQLLQYPFYSLRPPSSCRSSWSWQNLSSWSLFTFISPFLSHSCCRRRISLKTWLPIRLLFLLSSLYLCLHLYFQKTAKTEKGKHKGQIWSHSQKHSYAELNVKEEVARRRVKPRRGTVESSISVRINFKAISCKLQQNNNTCGKILRYP